MICKPLVYVTAALITIASIAPPAMARGTATSRVRPARPMQLGQWNTLHEFVDTWDLYVNPDMPSVFNARRNGAISKGNMTRTFELMTRMTANPPSSVDYTKGRGLRIVNSVGYRQLRIRATVLYVAKLDTSVGYLPSARSTARAHLQVRRGSVTHTVSIVDKELYSYQPGKRYRNAGNVDNIQVKEIDLLIDIDPSGDSCEISFGVEATANATVLLPWTWNVANSVVGIDAQNIRIDLIP